MAKNMKALVLVLSTSASCMQTKRISKMAKQIQNVMSASGNTCYNSALNFQQFWSEKINSLHTKNAISEH